MEAIMQVPGSDNAGPGSDILWSEFMLEGKETLLEKKKANSTIAQYWDLFYFVNNFHF